jgi:pimeloyl-ACP methyl ester carboxylesterase
MRRGYADTAAGQLHYYSNGRGKPLLLLHQTPRSARAFERMMQLLASQFRCVAVDFPGFGNSDPLPAKAKMENLAEYLVQLLDTLEIERAHVLGFHTGNKVAAAMAAKFAERIDRAVLIGMTHSLIVSRRQRDAAIMDIVKTYMSPRESQDDAQLIRAWAGDFGRLADIWWDTSVMSGRKVTDETLRVQESRMIEMIQCRHTIAQIYRMNFAFDMTAALRRIEAPVMVIECCTPEEAHLGIQGPKLVRLLKRPKLLTLRGAGFDATETYAEQIAKAVSEFLLQR